LIHVHQLSNILYLNLLPFYQNTATQTQPRNRASMKPSAPDLNLQAIAYSMDTLIPGLYFWWGNLKVRLGGSLPEPTYPGTIHSPIGIAIVLPGYRIYTTDQQTCAPRQIHLSMARTAASLTFP
jgi:hypothetical protein